MKLSRYNSPTSLKLPPGNFGVPWRSSASGQRGASTEDGLRSQRGAYLLYSRRRYASGRVKQSGILRLGAEAHHLYTNYSVVNY